MSSMELTVLAERLFRAVTGVSPGWRDAEAIAKIEQILKEEIEEAS